MSLDKNLTYMVKQNIKNITIIVALSVLIIFLLYWFFIGQHYESTDDAYLKSDITIVKPKVTGYIKDLFIQDNQVIQKGDVIARIDDCDYQEKVKQAESNLELAAYSIQKLEKQFKIQEERINEAKGKLDYASSVLERANKDYARAKNLIKEGAISHQSYDRNIESQKNSQAEYNSANANFLAVKEQLEILEAEYLSLQAKKKYSEAELSLSKIDLENTEIKAQNSGVITKNALQIGQLAQPGIALAYLVHSGKVWVEANFKETQIERIKNGQKVIIKIDSLQGKKFKGRVESMFPATGAEFSIFPPENATGNFTKIVQRIPIKIMFDENQDLSKLKPGMSSVISVYLK
ncbi:Multidrug export protein EmrA [Rickettsiales bacterium Ac37b]|nr:Multidrug export protein EmrA [Rickettsiales bacterium Ac37b]